MKTGFVPVFPLGKTVLNVIILITMSVDKGSLCAFLMYIELPKFTLEEADLQTAKDRWLYFVKNAGSLSFIPDTLAQQTHIHQAFDIANLAGLSDEELEA